MAGDWIKIEHATLDKPEIAYAAERLNLKTEEALGIFLRYFVWLDQNLDENRHGLVPFVSRKSLENTVRCPGFAGILEHIGWASFDDEHQVLTVRNWQRHNGSTAKSRALEQRKKARQRSKVSRFCPDPVPLSSGPEKRREELNTKSSSATDPVDNSHKVLKQSETWADHWQAKGKAFGIEPKRGETTGDYCRRVISIEKDKSKA